MELISLKNISVQSKILLLKQLGYQSEGEFIYDAEKRKATDCYIDIPVRGSNTVILPGSTIILDIMN
ncbi:hypothetical protein HYX11_04860 [Candidatus Woesearchaeota archaeon]|nr:hypothetical protein [Candidatus Woesearchaeota archaeon]